MQNFVCTEMKNHGSLKNCRWVVFRLKSIVGMTGSLRRHKPSCVVADLQRRNESAGLPCFQFWKPQTKWLPCQCIICSLRGEFDLIQWRTLRMGWDIPSITASTLRVFFSVLEFGSEETGETIAFLAKLYIWISTQIANSWHMQDLHHLPMLPILLLCAGITLILRAAWSLTTFMT